MASYWRAGGRGDRGADEVDDFDEYDPTPYGGGYDLHLTFGRPLPPSEETCYPISSSGGGCGDGVDYERPHYTSGSTPSAYEFVEGDGYGDRYGRPSASLKPQAKPQPAYGFRPQQEEEVGAGGGGEYGYGGGGRRPQPRPGYGSGEASDPPHAFGYGGDRPQWQQHQPPPPQPEEYGSIYGSGYGRPKRDEDSSYGEEYGPKYGSGYGGGRPKREEESSYGYEYGQDRPKPYRDEGAQEYGYGNNYKTGGEFGYGGDELRRTEEYGYGGGKASYERPAMYGGVEKTGIYHAEQEERYQTSRGYDPDKREQYGHRSYGNDSDDEEKKHHHHKYRHHLSHDDD